MAESNTNAVVVTVGLIQGDERYNCVFPMWKDDVMHITEASDLVDALEANLYPAWMSVLPTTTKLLGVQVEGMRPGVILPYRRNYAATTYVGARTGEPCPLQSSMLTAFYSSEQQMVGNRIRVGKKFWGTPSEADQNGGTITPASGLLALLEALTATLLAGFAGTSTGRWWPVLAVNRSAVNQDIYKADVGLVRQTLFTQRKRARPLI